MYKDIQLPQAITEIILSSLSWIELCKLMLVNRYFNNASRKNVLWEEIWRKRFPNSVPSLTEANANNSEFFYQQFRQHISVCFNQLKP